MSSTHSSQTDSPSEAQVKAVIRHALQHGSHRYLCGCDARVQAFVDRHYSLRGSLKIHAHALGWDILRVPINILWSAVTLLLSGVGGLAGLLRWHSIKRWVKRMPAGMLTDMDRQISWLVVTELLQLPYEYRGNVSEKDALMEEIVKDPGLQRLLTQRLDAVETSLKGADFQQRLQLKLAEYGATRTGSADLASNTMLLISSHLAMGQASFGALSAGTAASAAVAHSLAVSNFWLGSTIGSFYYALVPVAVSMQMVVGVTAAIAVVLAFVSTFIGILVDPLQVKLGLHQRRLRKLIASIHADLHGSEDSHFELREKYMGRLFDVVDLLSTVGRVS